MGDLSRVPVAAAIAALAALSLVPLGVLTYVGLTASERALEREVDRRMRSTVEASARSVQSEMHGLRSLVQSYARRPSLIEAMDDARRPRDNAALRRHLNELQATEEGIGTAFVADPDGVYLDGVPDTPAIVGLDFSHRDWYRGVVAAGGPYVSDAYQSAVTGNPLVTAAAVPIRAGDGDATRTVGILVAAFDLDRLERHSRPIAVPDKFELTVTDQTGNVVAGSSRRQDRIVSMARDERVRTALAGKPGAGPVTSGGEAMISAHAPIPGLGWAVVGQVPRRSALAPLSGLRSTLLGLSGFLAAAILGALLLTGRVLRQRRAFMAELTEAHRAALAASSLKSEFLATMSHEIRTPMNGVLGLLGVLRSTELDEDQRGLVETAEGSAISLLSIIDDVLDFSRIEAGRLELEDSAIDIRKLLHDVSGLLGDQARGKGLDLSVQVAPEVPALLRGDPGRVRQVVLNLAGNAIKFTPSGSVSISASAQDDTLRVEVRDTGIGMTADTVGRLFESFTQADRSTTRVYGGSGLGLAISRRLVELMGGLIGVDSRLDHGSCFWFSIPLRETAVSVDPVPGAIRVLVVDDQATNREMLHQSLTGWGMEPEVCASGEEAVEVAVRAAKEARPFDVMLIDHEMEGMDGIQLAEVITADPSLASAHLILLSSSRGAVDPRAARRAGIATWLTKPVRSSALYDAITAGVHASPRGPVVRSEGALPPSGTGRPANRVLKVLIAEDNPVNQQVATRMLELRGFEVDLVADGQAAVASVQTNAYDAVLMDCQMPVMDGFEATMAIRALDGPASAVPIVALTAGAMPGDAGKSLAAGMDAHITKPVAWDDAARVVRELVGGMRGEAMIEPSEAGSGVLDQTSLNELRDLGGDAQVDRLVKLFLESSAERLDAARSAAGAGDREELLAICHGLRGSAATIGAHELAAAALDLERDVRTSSEGWERGIDRVHAAFAAVRVEATRVLSGGLAAAGPASSSETA